MIRKALAAAWGALNSPAGHRLEVALIALAVNAVCDVFGLPHIPSVF